MDGERFDAVTRALTDTASRRKAIAGMLGGIVALVLGRGASAQGTGNPPKAGQACPPNTKACVAVANRPGNITSAVGCCPPGTVCYKCTAGEVTPSRGRGKPEGEIALGMHCCTPGVDCPGDPDASFPEANGHHLTFCQEVL